MQIVKPKVFLVGETRIIPEGLAAFFEHLGVPNWQSQDWAEGVPSDIEKLIEVCGRVCYMSFDPALNQNLTQVRPKNSAYCANILKSKHGSVLEHGFVNFMFVDVSRVFTHELVRHRVGISISQESLRFVRRREQKLWVPRAIREDEAYMTIFMEAAENAETMMVRLTEALEVDAQKDFAQKKILTSQIRRLMLEGAATNIAWGANIRALRHIIAMRTDPHAEEEIRLVFGKVGEIVKARYPNLFADFEVIDVDGLPHYKPLCEKVEKEP